jgi:hypothetical protein
LGTHVGSEAATHDEWHWARIRAGVQWLVMKETAALVAIGLEIGLPGALAEAGLTANQLSGLKPTICAATLFLAAVATRHCRR